MSLLFISRFEKIHVHTLRTVYSIRTCMMCMSLQRRQVMDYAKHATLPFVCRAMDYTVRVTFICCAPNQRFPFLSILFGMLPGASLSNEALRKPESAEQYICSPIRQNFASL